MPEKWSLIEHFPKKYIRFRREKQLKSKFKRLMGFKSFKLLMATNKVYLR